MTGRVIRSICFQIPSEIDGNALTGGGEEQPAKLLLMHFPRLFNKARHAVDRLELVYKHASW